MAGIVADHYFQALRIPILVNTGLQWGGVFLMVFFALSAYLFGMKWTKDDYKQFAVISFLKKRCLRIYLPLWFTLPMVIGIEYLIRHTLDMKTVLFNVVGLGWAKPFCVAGHLWYITLMMFLYLVYLVFSRVRLDKCKIGYWLIGYVAMASLYIFGERYFSTFSSVAPVITIFFASLLFFKSSELLEYSSRWSKVVLAVTILTMALSWYMYLQGWHDAHKAIATFSSFSAGFILFVCLLTLINSSINGRAVNHFADISYEIYLVHLPLLPFAKSLLNQIGVNNWLLLLTLWLMLTYFSALIVHIVTQRLMALINNKHE